MSHTRAVRLWSKTGTPLVNRLMGAATLIPGGTVLVTGGDYILDTPTATTLLYQPVSQKWAHTGTLVEARAHHTATLLPNGQVLIAGGTGNGGDSLATAELGTSQGQ